MKKFWVMSVLLSVCTWAQAQNVVGIDQLLSRKGMTCDVANSHLLHLTLGAVQYSEEFQYQFVSANQTLTVKDRHYTGIQAAEVLKSANGQQLALAVDANRFGLKVIRVALNVIESPYESVGYYWVAQGSPTQNRAQLQQLFGDGRWQDYVSTTNAGHTRIHCTIAG